MILLTGSSGLIGHRLAQLLQAEQVSTICLDPLAKASQNNLSKTYKGSTLRPNILDEIFDQYKIEQVVHLGMSSTTKEVGAAPQKAKDSIINGTSQLLQKMKDHKVPRIIYASTSMVYGDFTNDVAREVDACHPKETYGELKYQAEQIIRSQNIVNHIIFRPTAVYGADDRKDRVVAKFIRLAKENKPISVKGADTKLDFTHVDDVTYAIWLMIKNNKLNNKTYNIARGNARSLQELIEAIQVYFPTAQVELQDSDQSIPKRGTLDITKARNELGFIPKIDLEEGVASMIQGTLL